MKVRFGETVKFSQMALRLVPKILNAIDVIMFISEPFTMVNSVMLKLRNIQRVVTSKTVCIHNTVWLYLLPNNWKSCPGPGIGYHYRINLAITP